MSLIVEDLKVVSHVFQASCCWPPFWCGVGGPNMLMFRCRQQNLLSIQLPRFSRGVGVAFGILSGLCKEGGLGSICHLLLPAGVCRGSAARAAVSTLCDFKHLHLIAVNSS